MQKKNKICEQWQPIQRIHKEERKMRIEKKVHIIELEAQSRHKWPKYN